MSRRPAFSFYPGDWRNNANLRRCCWGARGVWVEVMGLMHDADEYGVLRWSLKEIAQAVGAPASLLREITKHNVMKGCDAGDCQSYIYTPRSGRKAGPSVTLLAAQPGPIWFSSRMLRDEYVRVNAGASTRFSTTPGDNSTPNPPPRSSPSRRQGDGPSSSSSSSSSNQDLLTSPEPDRKPESTARRNGAHAIGDIVSGEKRRKPQDKADADMIRFLMGKMRMELAYAVETVAAARDSGHDDHNRCRELCDKISRENKLGWFGKESP